MKSKKSKTFWVPRGYYSESKIKDDDVEMVLVGKYDKDDIISFLGEAFHTAFRKAIPDSDIGHKIWKLIQEMPREEWGAILEFVYWSMGPEYADAFRVATKPRG